MGPAGEREGNFPRGVLLRRGSRRFPAAMLGVGGCLGGKELPGGRGCWALLSRRRAGAAPRPAGREGGGGAGRTWGRKRRRWALACPRALRELGGLGNEFVFGKGEKQRRRPRGVT